MTNLSKIFYIRVIFLKWCSWGVNLVNGLPAIPTSRICGAILPLPLSFMVWLERPETVSTLISRNFFHFYIYISRDTFHFGLSFCKQGRDSSLTVETKTWLGGIFVMWWQHEKNGDSRTYRPVRLHTEICKSAKIKLYRKIQIIL